MTHEELYAKPFPDTWDNSMRTTGASCGRKLYFFLRGYDYTNRPAYFTFGSAWQEILLEWYSTPPIKDTKSQEFWGKVYGALEKGYAYWDAEAPIGNNDNKRELLETIFLNYVQTYPTEPFECIPGGGEAGWEFPIHGTPWTYAGSMDHYIKWEKYGFLCLENKTSGEYLSDGYVNQWDFSTQVKGYIWYLCNIHGVDQVYGALMNLVTKKVPGPRANWKTPRTTRHLVRMSKFALEQFIQDLLIDLEIFKMYFERDHWPMTSDARICVGGPGKAPCLFRPICATDADIRTVDPLNFENISLRSEEWTPWKRTGGQS